MLNVPSRAKARRLRCRAQSECPVVIVSVLLDTDMAAALGRQAILSGLSPNALAARLVAESLTQNANNTQNANEGEDHARPRPHD